MFDSEGDGVIDANEFWEMCCSIGREITLDQAKEALTKLDLNNDGVVDFDEFFTWWVPFEQRMQEKIRQQEVHSLCQHETNLSISPLFSGGEEEGIPRKAPPDRGGARGADEKGERRGVEAIGNKAEIDGRRRREGSNSVPVILCRSLFLCHKLLLESRIRVFIRAVERTAEEERSPVRHTRRQDRSVDGQDRGSDI